MQKTLLFLFLLITTVTVGCSYDEPEPVIISGTYTGTFSRITPGVAYRASTVSLTFRGKSFSGSSSIEKYPAICEGTFAIMATIIEFEDGCPWTTEFEWTYILDGEFEYSVEGNKLTLTRRYNSEEYDIYQLEKAE